MNQHLLHRDRGGVLRSGAEIHDARLGRDASPYLFKLGFERAFVLAGLAVALVFTAPHLCAQPVTLDWFVIASGGVMSSGSGDSLTAIIGQLQPEMTRDGGSTFLGGLSAVSQRILCPANLITTADPGQCTKSGVTYSATAIDSGPGTSVISTTTPSKPGPTTV